MKVIEVRPSKRFTGAWVSFEAPGVEPAFAAPEAKQKAIDYACGRFGGCTGEVHIYGDELPLSSARSLLTVAANIPRSLVIKKNGTVILSQWLQGSTGSNLP